MPVARFQMPDGRIARFEVPDGTSPEQAEQLIQQELPSLVAPPPAKAAPFSLSDTAINAAQGAIGATKAITEAFGAGNAPAEYLEGIQKSLGESLSPQRQAEMQRRKQIEDIAAKSGKTFDEVSAALGGIKEAPIQSVAQGVGSALPTVALGIGAGALGATFGAPIAIAAGVGLGVKYLIGALQGAGEVKGTVYDAVRDGLIAQGVPEEKAKERASASQNYIGENWGTIAGGAGLGAWAGGTGVEKELLNKFSKPVAAQVAKQEAAKIAEKEAAKGTTRKFVEAGAKEAVPEGFQGGQSQYAENVAKTRAGMETPAMQGVAGAAARDAAVGALTGAAVRPFTGSEPVPVEEPKTEQEREALLQLGTNKPFVPVVFPDGSVATTPEEVRQHEEDKFNAQYAPEKVREPEQLNLPGMENLNPPAEDNIPEPRIFNTAEEVEAARAKEERAAIKEADATRKEAETAGQIPLSLRRTPEGQPTASGQPEPTISAEDIMMTAIPLRTAAKWVEKNVAGRTLSQVADMVKRDPTLIAGKDPRAQLLKTLLQKEVPAFKETENVAPTEKPTTKRVDQLRASEPSVVVPVKPARVVPPAAATVAREPEAPVGRGLVPTGQPVDAGAKPKAAQPAALKETPPAVATETVDAAAQRKKDAEEMRLAMEAQDKTYAKGPKPKGVEKVAIAPKPAEEAKPPVTKTAAAAKRSEEAAQTDKDWQGVMDRVSKLKSPFDILGARKSEAPANKEPASKEPRIGKTEQFGTQGKLFPLSKDNAKREAQRTPTAEEPTETKAEKDERQMELAARKKDVPEWSSSRDNPQSTTVYGDDEVALVRQHNTFGQYVYVARKPGGVIGMSDIDGERYDADKFKENWITREQIDRLRKVRSDVVFEESKKASKNPDGPFTGAQGNVVGSDGVDPRYVGYLQSLMQSMGLGNVRVFLVHPQDVQAEGGIDKYKLYREYASVLTAGDTKEEEGSVRAYGPDKRDFYISFKPGMSENKSVEVISHELGHAIEQIAFNNATPETKAAIKKEYEAWVLSTKGKTGRELVQSLRNRETAETQMMSVDEDRRAEDMRPYWTLFTEWFADNTSRWASTSEKPISITEKFFSNVAQKMRDFVALITGRKYPPSSAVAKFLDQMGPGSADTWLSRVGSSAAPVSEKASFSVFPSTEQIINGMGPLSNEDKSFATKLVDGFNTDAGIDFVTQLRTQQADSAAAIESRFSKIFNGAVRDKMGKLNPMGLYRQAQDHAKLLLDFFQRGAITKNKTTGLWEVADNKAAPIEVYKLIDAYAKKNGYTRDRATQVASRILEAHRLDGLLKANPDFPSHIKPAELAQLVAEYKADPDFAAMNAAMDKPRIALIDHMVDVGRLTKETAAEWKSVVGYVPFDRIEDFSTAFANRKKLTGKSPLAISTNPELVGSFKRPVGNVFDNYINTLGWLVKEVMNNDARLVALNGLQDLGAAKNQKRDASGPNVVNAYVNGEMNYWELPSKYDVMAFKDLNPPKWAIMRFLGQFSNILRTTVTALPPFALKQVSDDVQRAIMTSGVKNVSALVRMSLTNFPKVAFAELRGIQHPYVKEFGALGLTGEFDFQEGRPAESLLSDLGYKPRGKVKELLHRLNGITRASDLSVRKAIYDQTMIETKDKLLAQTRAREFINFRRRGASEFASVMTTTIPFYNSYVQGMDVLYRAASGIDSSSSVGRAEARKLFMSRAATALMLSTIYALGKSDDDDYNEMDLRTRDNNWIIGDGIKLPVPGELGAVFKVIPERVVEYMRRQGTPEEQEAFEAVRTTLGYMFEQYVGRVMPIPQAAKPLLEAFTNHSFLTGRELEGIHQKSMVPSMRRTASTSELAIAIADFSRENIKVEISPIMIDNSLRGYFGSTAAMATMVTDGLLNPTRMDRPLHKLALVSNYAYDPVGTRRTTEFYEEREKVGQLNATLKELVKTDVEAAGRFAEKHANTLALESAIGSTLDQIENTRAYRKYLESSVSSEDMTKEERAASMEEVRRIEVDMVSWLREAKAELRNQPQ